MNSKCLFFFSVFFFFFFFFFYFFDTKRKQRFLFFSFFFFLSFIHNNTVTTTGHKKVVAPAFFFFYFLFIFFLTSWTPAWQDQAEPRSATDSSCQTNKNKTKQTNKQTKVKLLCTVLHNNDGLDCCYIMITHLKACWIAIMPLFEFKIFFFFLNNKK